MQALMHGRKSDWSLLPGVGSAFSAILAVILSFIVSSSFRLSAEAPRPFKTIDLNRARITAQGCENKWKDWLTRVIWLDEQHFAVALWAAGCPSDSPSGGSTIVVAVFDMAGSLQGSIHRDDLTTFAKGPRGTLVGSSWRNAEIFGADLKVEQIFDCPANSEPCGISLAPGDGQRDGPSDGSREGLGSEFALCSGVSGHQLCDYYRGRPAMKVSSANDTASEATDPYTGLAVSGFRAAWQVSAAETWTFKGGTLTRIGADGASSAVSAENFVGTNGGGCDGQMSGSEPRRFLAVCRGAHWYSDGMFDSIFGFSRVVLFEVPSGRQITRLDGPVAVNAELSPSGKSLAVVRGSKIRLYDVTLLESKSR